MTWQELIFKELAHISEIELKVWKFFNIIMEEDLKRAEDWMLMMHKFNWEIKDII